MVTNFQSQNSRWPPGGHVYFPNVPKIQYAQLDLRENLPVKVWKDFFNTYWEIAVTNFQSQNPRWPPGGHVYFPNVPKILYALLDIKMNMYIEFQQDPCRCFWEIAVTNFQSQNPRWPPGSHVYFPNCSKIRYAQLDIKVKMYIEFQQDPCRSFWEITVTNFQSQNPRRPPGGHVYFPNCPKIRYAQLDLKMNMYTQFQWNPFNSFLEIVVTNFQSQNPRWPPGGHVYFPNSPKIRYAQLDIKVKMCIEFQQDPFSSFWEIAVTRIVNGRTTDDWRLTPDAWRLTTDDGRTTDAGWFEKPTIC